MHPQPQSESPLSQTIHLAYPALFHSWPHLQRQAVPQYRDPTMLEYLFAQPVAPLSQSDQRCLDAVRRFLCARTVQSARPKYVDERYTTQGDLPPYLRYGFDPNPASNVRL
ncbi:Uncharacterised protein [Vibrio cholerae]|nr:Uncharacterised protein [Vibrio cholerae]